jgi:TonB family protein
MSVPQQFAPLDEPLHVIGDNHPLQKVKRRLLIRAAMFALLIHVAGFGTILLPKLFRGKGETGRLVELKQEFRTELPAPPSISGGPAGPVIPGFTPGGRPPTAALGIPDPVPDLQAEAPTIAAQSEIGAPINPDGIEGLGGGGGGGGGSWNLDTLSFNPGDQLLDPDAFVAVEQMPVLVTMPKPEYPRMARESGMSGQVVVRALVGKDGKVHKTLKGSGEEVLYGSAERAVRSAVFKPAINNRQPVAVWVAVPVNFTLQ